MVQKNQQQKLKQNSIVQPIDTSITDSGMASSQAYQEFSC